MVGKGLEFSVILEFLYYTSITLVPMALPLSILMSSLMTFGNLGERYELTAIKASGISLQRIMSPLIIVVVFISIGAFFFANRVLPYAHLQMRSLLYDIQQQRPELQIKPGAFNNLVDGYSIRVENKNPKTGTMYHLQIYDHTKGKGNVSVTVADSGTMKATSDEKNLIMTLYNGRSYNELQEEHNVPLSRRSYPHRYDKFEKEHIVIELTGYGLQRTDQSLFKSHYAMMDLEQLTTMEDSLKKEINQKQNQLYRNLVRGNLFKKSDRLYNNPASRTPEAVSRINIDARRQGLLRKPHQTEHGVIESEEVNNEFKQKDEVDNVFKQNTKNKENKEKEPDQPTEETQKENVKTVNVDSLFNLLTLRDKYRVLGTAITYARTSKNIVANSAQTLDFKIRYLRRYEIEWHRKFTIAFACLVFLFIGAPLGAIIRKGGLGLPLVLSIIFFIFYYILSLTGDKLVRESLLPAYQGMWLSSFVFFTIGVFLTYKATTDSSMLNMDTYMNFIKKYFGQRYNVVDKVNIDTIDTSTQAKISKIKASLITLQDSTNEILEWKRNQFKISEFITGLYSVNADPALIQYDRYYNNTFRILINNQIFHNKSVRDKVYDFPSISQDDLTDKNWKLILRIALACIPPATLLVALRHFIRLILFDIKLKRIKLVIPELLSIINVNFPDSTNENTSSLQ